MARTYDLVYLAVLAIALAEVAIELWVSRKNERRLRAEGYREVAPWVFRAMVPVYMLAFAAGPLERFGSPDRGAPWRLGIPLLGGLVMAKVLKIWVIRTLRGNWTKKVFVKEGMPIRTDGPFAWVRHPNYVAMVFEIAALGFLGGTPITGSVVSLSFGALLLARIATEESALRRATPYREMMAAR
ncbi:MAG: isoprenylcysteine carboxylmethyltransferase family protein [Acidobacteriota bacterium]